MEEGGESGRRMGEGRGKVSLEANGGEELLKEGMKEEERGMQGTEGERNEGRAGRWSRLLNQRETWCDT